LSEFADLVVIQLTVGPLKNIGADFQHQSLGFHGKQGKDSENWNLLEFWKEFRKLTRKRVVLSLIPEFPIFEVLLFQP